MRVLRPQRAVQRGAAVLERLLDPAAAQPLMWRSLAGIYLAAAAIMFTTLAFGLDPGAREGLLAAIGAGALVSGILALLLAPRIPAAWMLPALLANLATVSVAVVASGEADSPYALFYVWHGAATWFFLRARAALAMTLVTAVVAAIAMLALAGGDGDRDTLAWVAAVVGSMIAVGALAGVLHGRAQRMIDRLGEAAVRDPLTGLLNRRGYQQRLAEELARARRFDTPLSIVLADLDAFKKLNDRFGHRRGDDALRGFAELCHRHLREVDSVCRVGGEEFAIVLPNTSERAAVLAGERLRRAVRSELQLPDGAPITASFGVATFPHHGSDAEVLLDHADQAMYAAKAMGRDRTVVFGYDLPQPQESGRQEHRQAVLLLAETLDLRDAGTSAHSETVALLCEQIATALGLPPDRVERIRLGGRLHDIGKIGVPDDILRKRGKLTPAEWDEMRKHSELGARIVDGAGLDDIAGWVLAHHERPDGSGYPYGLAGDAIPLEARILAVADAYEAMTADRPYRAAIGVAAALAELERGAGAQFDPAIVQAFLGAEHGARAA